MTAKISDSTFLLTAVFLPKYFISRGRVAIPTIIRVDLSISCSGIPKGGCKGKCDKARDKSDTAYDSCRQHAKSP